MSTSQERPLLVVGAGIAGVTSALEAAEAGEHVVLVERDPSIGGSVVRNHHYFPKLCPPTCGMEINVGRLERNSLIRLMTNTQVAKADAADGGWSVTLNHAPAYVNERCTACGDCSAVCPAKVKDPHNFEMNEVPAIRLPHMGAHPKRFTLNRSACPDGCTKCAEACKYGAIDLNASAVEEVIEVGSVIHATGWKPYPLENLPEFGGGKLADVIANVGMERLVSPAGPTAGKIVRLSDGKPPERVVFVQCAGSRDINHLAYCSAICCLVSLKQAIYVREQLPECEVKVYFIDRRTPGRNEEMLNRVAAMEGVILKKGKVAQIELGSGGRLDLRVEDTETERLIEESADMVVLATGMASCLGDAQLPFPFEIDDDGFGVDNPQKKLFFAGVAKRPEDVAACTRDATGAAAKAACAMTRTD